MSQVDRRDFLKLAGAGGVALFLEAFAPRVAHGLSLPEAETYRLPSIGQVKTWNRSPQFWTGELEPGQTPIFVRQFDPLQYRGYDGKIPLEGKAGFMNNSCGFAALAMVEEWLERIYEGKASGETTIWQVYKSFIGETYVTGRNRNVNPIVRPDGGSRLDSLGLSDALKVIVSKSRYGGRVVEITPPLVTSGPERKGEWGLFIDNAHPYGEWQELFDKTNAEVISKGGIAVLCIAKYGGAHFSLCPFVPANGDDNVLYLDSRGYNKEGIVEIGSMDRFTWAIAEICGVIPNLPSGNFRISIPS